MMRALKLTEPVIQSSHAADAGSQCLASPLYIRMSGHPKIDRSTSDISQVAIFRDLFQAVANKCLRLGYFSRMWKVAAIKVIPKPGKNYQSRPKSYCPIGLLSVMSKTVEMMLVWAFDAEVAGQIVWFHATARNGGLPV
ncbi:hypothetical protein EVAR_4932_1 [Eumeta japonica]|uniref:RNA-directed DNA polymerase from mobile element jockey n=1 Tax=Eumeta variegata TaxID=151549 RepID=A0A4C1V0A9_EUMVA|nr:hypothetical protein EVAR_4932_1 [Eumeta japonica]